MTPRPLYPRVSQLRKILKGIFHIPISASPLTSAYSD
jgi:hypothetical protein